MQRSSSERLPPAEFNRLIAGTGEPKTRRSAEMHMYACDGPTIKLVAFAGQKIYGKRHMGKSMKQG